MLKVRISNETTCLPAGMEINLRFSSQRDSKGIQQQSCAETSLRICFGQQPCGFFPKRFLYAKIQSASKLQKEIGGEIIFFYHDSDADYRETITVMRDKTTGKEVRLNFLQENKIQKKYSPLYLKRIPQGWKEETIKQLPRFVDKPLIDIFASIKKTTVADFCLEMYKQMGLVQNIKIVRSSDPSFRKNAIELSDFHADIPYQGEIVRAGMKEEKLFLHKGGGKYITFLPSPIAKIKKSAPKALRFSWMQSVIRCTHYIMGESEEKYLDIKAFPEVIFIKREPIENPNYAWIDYLPDFGFTKVGKS